jgi:hypothetical protein
VTRQRRSSFIHYQKGTDKSKTMLLLVVLSIILCVCRGFSPGAHRGFIARRRTFTLHLAPFDDFSLLVNAVSTMTEEDARNFEIIKLFAPAAIPFIFITSFSAILFRTIETQEKSTKESIAVTKEQIVASEKSTKELIAVIDKSNKDAAIATKEQIVASDKSNKELIAVIDKSNKDAIMATNNLIMSNKNDAQRQIDAFEERFNHFYNDVRSNMKNN